MSNVALTCGNRYMSIPFHPLDPFAWQPTRRNQLDDRSGNFAK